MNHSQSLRALLVLSLGLQCDAATACSCEEAELSLDSAVQESEFVLWAHVDAAAPVMCGGERWLEVQLSEVVELGDEKYPFRSALTPYDRSACGHPVRVPEYYWFFLDENGAFYSCSFTSESKNPRVASLTPRIVDKLVALKRGDSEYRSQALPSALNSLCGAKDALRYP